MERKNYTVAVDLGSSNVVVAVGAKNADGAMEVVSVISKSVSRDKDNRPVAGVRAGRIENIELVGGAIAEAIAETQEQLGIQITEAYAGISGEFVRGARHTDHVFVYDPQNGINQKDVDALFDRMRNVQAPEDETIMARIPQHYTIDEQQEAQNPVGTFGRKLSATFNFVLCQNTPMQRLNMALKRVGIKILDIIPATLATPEALLTPDEKEEGVAVVDVGGGVTDITVYHGGIVRYIASIPMGASAIDRDIRTMSVPERLVESFKQRYGSAVAELASDKMIRINGRTAREAKDILLCNLATVIEARATDIAEFVLQELQDSGYAGKLTYGIVLTGGSAKLKDLDELLRRITKMEVRVGIPEQVAEESRKLVADPAYATVVGLLLQGAAQGGCAGTVVHAQPRKEPAAPVTPRPENPTPRPQQNPFATPAQPYRAPQPAPQPIRPQPVAEPQQPAARPAVQQQQPQPQQQPDAEPTPQPEPAAPYAEPAEPKKKNSITERIKRALAGITTTFTEPGGDDEI